jgi:hypothetical protein
MNRKPKVSDVVRVTKNREPETVTMVTSGGLVILTSNGRSRAIPRDDWRCWELVDG